VMTKLASRKFFCTSVLLVVHFDHNCFHMEIHCLGCGKVKVEARRRFVTFPSDDVMQFTGCCHLSLLYYLWLQTSSRSSCFCYYQRDWVTQHHLHFPIRQLDSTHRSIATHPLPRPSFLSVRPKIGVPTVTHQLFIKNNL
jgi:hypothetical protein